MATNSAFSAFPEVTLEERLFLALANDPLEQREELLDYLEDVDVRMLNRKTLLQNGVRLGKVDWVEELLARGADPNLEDDCHLTALSSAEEMLRRDPGDSDLRQVMRLLRMVDRRDQAMRRRLQTSAVRSAVSSTPPVCQSSDYFSAMSALSSSVDALKEEMRSLRVELSSSLEELKERLCGRNALMRRLGGVVTSSIEELTTLSECLPGETTLRAIRTVSETPLSLHNTAEERSECVEGMMGRTEVVFGGEEGVERMRKLYERFYDGDVVTKCLLLFLHRDSRFAVKVDCGSERIDRMKETVVDLDGRDRSGGDCRSFAEFSTHTVYLGAKVDWRRPEGVIAGWFAWALAQMSLYHCFKNGGKPYEDGDVVREIELKRAFEEAEKEDRKRGDEFEWWVRWPLKGKSQTEREFYLAASVPQIIARSGSDEGTRLLREQVPRLLHYFKEHVVATLLDKAWE